MSLFSTTPPREKPLLPAPRKRLEIPLWVVTLVLFLIGCNVAFYCGRLYERHSFDAKVDRLYLIKSALGTAAAEQYLRDHP